MFSSSSSLSNMSNNDKRMMNSFVINCKLNEMTKSDELVIKANQPIFMYGCKLRRWGDRCLSCSLVSILLIREIELSSELWDVYGENHETTSDINRIIVRNHISLRKISFHFSFIFLLFSPSLNKNHFPIKSWIFFSHPTQSVMCARLFTVVDDSDSEFEFSELLLFVKNVELCRCSSGKAGADQNDIHKKWNEISSSIGFLFHLIPSFLRFTVK